MSYFFLDLECRVWLLEGDGCTGMPGQLSSVFIVAWTAEIEKLLGLEGEGQWGEGGI